ncbi:branched-chain amino acid ABC transporter permease [Nocardioides sp. LMS-CY]|uniref:branched-chain amino acid ABC transporter permease n=1 Tax=Nocardioides sp. (strain LMS-CY) TaxID=2840457 RepID=UPI001C007ABA|nr:branched-chain amino acid ABC transporter permease [Nocardioides sp. LMS-CY]QWF21326.1 branched-chain amino acid ABC transporter permease [Nocardioides sp. LMS-CY]
MRALLGKAVAARRALALAALGVLFVVVYPQLATAGQLSFANTVVIAVVFATSTNLLFGQAGIPSFGQAGFFGAGAYAAALAAHEGLPVILCLLIGILAGALVGVVAAAVAWRSAGLAFSMLTLAFAQSLYTIAIRTDALGGYNGLAGFPFSRVLGIELSDPGYVWYFVAVFAAVIVAGFWQVSRSPFGQILRALRDDPVRTLFLGINVRAYRTLAFVLAAAGAGAAGALSAYVNQVVTPDSLYWTASAVPVMMLVLGGMGHFAGPAIGALLYAVLEHYLSAWTTSYIFFLGILVYLVLALLPDGVVSLPRTVRYWIRRGGGDPPTPDEVELRETEGAAR